MLSPSEGFPDIPFMDISFISSGRVLTTERNQKTLLVRAQSI